MEFATEELITARDKRRSWREACVCCHGSLVGTACSGFYVFVFCYFSVLICEESGHHG